MLNLVVRNTSKLIRAKSKSDNVRLGRLFTKKDTARIMADMLEIDKKKAVYTVLDPGAGTGILAAAAVERICRDASACKQIFLTCYESDPTYIPMLEDNLERIRKKCRHDYDVRLFVTIYPENYLTDAKKHYTVTFFDVVPDKYDIIICNPPTELCEKGSPEAEGVGGISQLKLSLAFLFLKLAATHTELGGQLVITLPTTYASASSLAPIRSEISEELAITGMHLFVGKQKNEKRAVPLKKNMLISWKRADKPELIHITTSTDSGKTVVPLPALKYDFIVSKKDGTLTLPKSVEDTKIVQYISSFPETLTTLGLKMSTGLIVDSKCEGLLFSEPIKGTVPLLRPATIKRGQVEFPQPTKRQYIAPVNPSLVQRNKNMILIKRVPAKSDARFVNAGVHLASRLPEAKYISTHNKLNFIDMKDKNIEMPAKLAYGLFALLNSTIYDRYISIVSKSKQINSKEMRDLPLPPLYLIENMGMRLMSSRQTSVEICDAIVNPTLHIIER
ncbi:MAG: hypothetical protein IJD51_06025 [Clostridia bacterium]|nr:hypothetical protein [Clostridia bacterium]